MSLLDGLPDDLRLRVLHFLPPQERAKLALLSKACQLLSLDKWSAFSMTWDEGMPWTWGRGKSIPKLSNMLNWLAKLAQHSQHTLHSLELHCRVDERPDLTLPRKPPITPSPKTGLSGFDWYFSKISLHDLRILPSWDMDKIFVSVQ